MEIAFFLVALIVVVLTGTAVADRIGLPPPLLLVVVGVAGSYLPGMPEIHLEAEVVLLGLLPPLLYAAAVQTSLVDFNANRRPILLLSVGLVAFTTLGVGAVAMLLLPDLGWPLALAIGAVVAPPDAVAATAIGRRIGLPRRVVTILEGESLLNDATALVALRTAIAAAGIAGAAHGAADVSTAYVVGDFLRAAIGGVVAGSWSSSSSRRYAATSPTRCSTPASRSWCRSPRSCWPRSSTPPAWCRSSSPGCCSATRRRSSRPRSHGSRSG